MTDKILNDLPLESDASKFYAEAEDGHQVRIDKSIVQQFAARQANAAQHAAAKAEAMVETIKETIQELPDGQAVSAQVAVNTAKVEQIEETLGDVTGMVCLTMDEYEEKEQQGEIDANTIYLVEE